MKTFLLYFVLLSTVSYGQDVLSISQLKCLAQSRTLNDFDTKVRRYGYSFDHVDKEDTHTYYMYTKKISNGTTSYTNILSYADWNDGKPVMRYSTAIDGSFFKLKTELSRGFSEPTTSVEGGMLSFEYLSSQYRVSIFELKKENEGLVYTSTTITFVNRLSVETNCELSKVESSPGNSSNSKNGYISDSDGTTNLRSQPTASSVLIQKVYNGTRFSIIFWAGDWLRSRLDNGAVGYIHKTRAKFTN